MYDGRTRVYIARCLADAFLSGVWDERALVYRAGLSLEPLPRWVRPLARQTLAAYHRPPLDRPRELARYVERWMQDRAEPEQEPDPPRVRRWLVPQSAMGTRRWPVPEVASVGGLAEYLGLTHGELAWMADVRGLERSVDAERLRHYRYRALARRGGPPRLIERPKPRLKAIQRRLLHEILDWIPVHEAAHGFTRGRSAASHAREHVGQYVIVSADLEDFFASIAAGRVFGIFRAAGYPESVAHALTGLTTNVVPLDVWRALPPARDASEVGIHHRLGRRLATAHLPQGAPTSPALANLAAFRLDRRLSGLAAALELSYTRYADDLTFSGSRWLARHGNELRATIGAIAREEGFSVNQRKSSLTTRAGQQRVCGIVVNQRANVARADYDRLKAILHNAAIHGPQSQNRAGVPDFRAHLLGRIAWVRSLHSDHGERLQHQFAQITWPDEP